VGVNYVFRHKKTFPLLGKLFIVKSLLPAWRFSSKLIKQMDTMALRIHVEFQFTEGKVVERCIV
jgi:hypothetical protein